MPRSSAAPIPPRPASPSGSFPPGSFPPGASSGPATANVAADYDAQQKKNRLITILVAIAAIAAGVFGLKAAGLLRLGAETPRPALQVRGDGPSPALQLPAEVKPAPLQQGAERKQMPADVEAWLKHLEQCEKEKVTISGDQMAEAMVLMQKMQALGAGMGLLDPYDQSSGDDKDQDPGSYAKGKVMDFRPRWEQLLAFFNSKAPPEECKPLAADFNQALSEVPGMMGDVGDILNAVSSDPAAALQKAQKLKGGSYGDIDRYFGRADAKLTQICEKYEKHKWFNIKTDVQGGSPLASFGSLGGASGAGGAMPGLGG